MYLELLDLPEEIICHLLNFLNPEELLVVRSTCQRLNQSALFIAAKPDTQEKVAQFYPPVILDYMKHHKPNEFHGLLDICIKLKLVSDLENIDPQYSALRLQSRQRALPNIPSDEILEKTAEQNILLALRTSILDDIRFGLESPPSFLEQMNSIKSRMEKKQSYFRSQKLSNWSFLLFEIVGASILITCVLSRLNPANEFLNRLTLYLSGLFVLSLALTIASSIYHSLRSTSDVASYAELDDSDARRLAESSSTAYDTVPRFRVRNYYPNFFFNAAREQLSQLPDIGLRGENGLSNKKLV